MQEPQVQQVVLAAQGQQVQVDKEVKLVCKEREGLLEPLVQLDQLVKLDLLVKEDQLDQLDNQELLDEMAHQDLEEALARLANLDCKVLRENLEIREQKD